MQHKGEFGPIDGEHLQKSMTVRAITKGGHLNVKQHPDQNKVETTLQKVKTDLASSVEHAMQLPFWVDP